MGFQRSGIGPETFYYREMVEMIAREIGSSALIVAMPPMLAYQGVRVLGWMVRDVINTRDEVRGLMQEGLYVDSPPLGTTKLSNWVRASCATWDADTPANCNAVSTGWAATARIEKSDALVQCRRH